MASGHAGALNAHRLTVSCCRNENTNSRLISSTATDSRAEYSNGMTILARMPGLGTVSPNTRRPLGTNTTHRSFHALRPNSAGHSCAGGAGGIETSTNGSGGKAGRAGRGGTRLKQRALKHHRCGIVTGPWLAHGRLGFLHWNCVNTGVRVGGDGAGAQGGEPGEGGSASILGQMWRTPKNKRGEEGSFKLQDQRGRYHTEKDINSTVDTITRTGGHRECCESSGSTQAVQCWVAIHDPPAPARCMRGLCTDSRTVRGLTRVSPHRRSL